MGTRAGGEDEFSVHATCYHSSYAMSMGLSVGIRTRGTLLEAPYARPREKKNPALRPYRGASGLSTSYPLSQL